MTDDIEEDGGDIAGQHDAKEPPAHDNFHNYGIFPTFCFTDSHGVASNNILLQV